jgi:hypothetical protein
MMDVFITMKIMANTSKLSFFLRIFHKMVNLAPQISAKTRQGRRRAGKKYG